MILCCKGIQCVFMGSRRVNQETCERERYRDNRTLFKAQTVPKKLWLHTEWKWEEKLWGGTVAHDNSMNLNWGSTVIIKQHKNERLWKWMKDRSVEHGDGKVCRLGTWAVVQLWINRWKYKSQRIKVTAANVVHIFDGAERGQFSDVCIEQIKTKNLKCETNVGTFLLFSFPAGRVGIRCPGWHIPGDVHRPRRCLDDGTAVAVQHRIWKRQRYHRWKVEFAEAVESIEGEWLTWHYFIYAVMIGRWKLLWHC